MIKPKLSIIIPVYNVELYLDKCIESIRNQTLREIEIILVNDGSTDSSGYICKKYAELDSRIKIITKPNGGLSSARNAGIKASKAEYIGFVDGDDYIASDMYKVMYEKAIENNCDIVISQLKQDISNRNYNYMYPEYKKLDREFIIDTLIPNILSGKNEMFVTNKIYRKSIITKNNLEFKKTTIWEDKIFNLELYPYINSMYYIPKQFYTYRVVWGSMVRKYHKDKFDVVSKIYDIQLSIMNKCNIKDVNTINKHQKCFLNNSIVCISEQYIIKQYNDRKIQYNKIIENNNFQKILNNKYATLDKDNKFIFRVIETFIRKKRYLLMDITIVIYGNLIDRLRIIKRSILRRKK